MENGIKMIFVSKWFFTAVEYIDSKITIWPPDDISLIYLCWVTYMQINPSQKSIHVKDNMRITHPDSIWLAR